MTPATLAATPPRLLRRLVLGTAFLAAMAVGFAPPAPPAHAQTAAPAAPTVPDDAVPKAKAGSTTRSATINIKADDRSVTIDARTPSKEADSASADEEPDPSELSIGKGRHGKRVRVGILGDDREFDSFSDFVHNEPALAAMVVSIVAIVFLTPVLVIVLILWYRMRKARMLNETMLKLAEKGVVPPAEALGALAGSSAPLAAAPSAAPIYEQAKQIRRRAAWSDLRKGVILGGIGLGLTAYSMLDDGSPNGLGLVLLFVGIGYLVLWWFEERQFAARSGAPGAAPPAPPPAGNAGGP